MKLFQLCSADGPLGIRVIRLVTRDAGLQLVGQRKAVRVVNTEEELIGFQLASRKGELEIIIRPSAPSSTAFSRAEADAIAGAHFKGGQSRTANMTEAAVIKRVSRGLPAMDLVQAAQVKLSFYQQVH